MAEAMSLFDLSGRTALVTGATQGLGLAIVQALAAQGARVIVSDRDATACARAAAALRWAGHEATGLAAELAQAGSIDALCDAAAVIDVLVCNAGIQGPAGPIADPAFMARRLQATPLRRVGEPREVAGVVVMLASRAGGFVTGHNLVVDGGTTISDGS